MAMLETSGMLSVQRMAALPKMLALLLAGELMWLYVVALCAQINATEYMEITLII